MAAMRLYLVQHGEAKSEAEDPDRPLTDRGAAYVREVAKRATAAAGRKLVENAERYPWDEARGSAAKARRDDASGG
jgi:broad specificity phosphatase PhoE